LRRLVNIVNRQSCCIAHVALQFSSVESVSLSQSPPPVMVGSCLSHCPSIDCRWPWRRVCLGRLSRTRSGSGIGDSLWSCACLHTCVHWASSGWCLDLALLQLFSRRARTLKFVVARCLSAFTSRILRSSTSSPKSSIGVRCTAVPAMGKTHRCQCSMQTCFDVQASALST